MIEKEHDENQSSLPFAGLACRIPIPPRGKEIRAEPAAAAMPAWGQSPANSSTSRNAGGLPDSLTRSWVSHQFDDVPGCRDDRHARGRTGTGPTNFIAGALRTDLRPPHAKGSGYPTEGKPVVFGQGSHARRWPTLHHDRAVHPLFRGHSHPMDALAAAVVDQRVIRAPSNRGGGPIQV